MDARKEGLPRNPHFSAQVRATESAPGHPEPLLSLLRRLLPPLDPRGPAVLGRRAGQGPAGAVPAGAPAGVPWGRPQLGPAGGPGLLCPRRCLPHLAPGLSPW
uniref:Transmembrane protein 86B n=1 Tax=Molossus molossus TaxID=27622 RepID=A0A7J8CBQ8_MOLMO|nr:transmembrane protein 86B [Molossus molossus]